MEHAEHEPGTMQECPECRALAVEPGWYKVLRARMDTKAVLVPEADDGEVAVIVPDVPARPDVEVLDLQPADRDE